MNLVRNRVAALGAAGALATGSVVAGGVLSPAAAATGNYNCTFSSGPGTVPIVGTMSLPGAPVAPGAAVPGVPTTFAVALPATISTFLATLGVTSLTGSASNVSFPIGSTGSAFVAPSLATTSPVTVVSGAVTTLTGSGTSGLAAAPTTPGTYDVLMPQSFTFVPVTNAGAPLPAVPCQAAGAQAVLGQLTVLGDAPAPDKEATRTRATFLNAPLTTGERPLTRVTVLQADGDPAAGMVVVKKGKKVLKKVALDDTGKKRFRLAALPRGEHRLVFRYLGDEDSEPSRVVKTVRVRRG